MNEPVVVHLMDPDKLDKLDHRAGKGHVKFRTKERRPPPRHRKPIEDSRLTDVLFDD